MITECTECGSANLRWEIGTEVNDIVPEGRLRKNDVSPVACLACMDCFETLALARGGQLERMLNSESDQVTFEVTIQTTHLVTLDRETLLDHIGDLASINEKAAEFEGIGETILDHVSELRSEDPRAYGNSLMNWSIDFSERDPSTTDLTPLEIQL